MHFGALHNIISAWAGCVAYPWMGQCEGLNTG